MYPRNSSRVPFAQLPTPLQLLERVSTELDGPRIWVKRDDLTGSTLSGNKVRKLEYLVADAKEQGADVLITSGGAQSNHCRATALVAAQSGLRAHLLLRGERPATPDANLLLDQLAGASTSFYSPREYQANLLGLFDHWCRHYAEKGLKPYVIPTGGSNAVGIWGYLGAALEMEEQFRSLALDPQCVVCATGSGGTQAGLTLGLALLRPRLQVLGIAVCDSEAYFRKKVAADIELWHQRYRPEQPLPSLKISTEAGYIGPGYGEASPAVFETIQWLARTEGLILDPVYTGKAFHGLVEEVRRGRLRDMEDVVFVHTGGVFGIFPYRSQLSGIQ